MRYRMLLFATAVTFATAAGCSGGPKFAAVSGVVTVDGEPYPKAVVSFQPISTDKNTSPGKGSSAYTDANGRFVLIGTDGETGAIVGKHRVRIMTAGNNVVGASDTGSDDKVDAPNIDPIPQEWNAKSEKEFDVPAGGTDQANFAIVSNRKKK
jgi:hypothetical protein